MTNSDNIVQIKGQNPTSLAPRNGLKISGYFLSKKEVYSGRCLKASFKFKRTLKLTMAAATAKKALKRNRPKFFLVMFLKTVKTNFNLLFCGFKKEGKIAARAMHFYILFFTNNFAYLIFRTLDL